MLHDITLLIKGKNIKLISYFLIWYFTWYLTSISICYDQCSISFCTEPFVQKKSNMYAYTQMEREAFDNVIDKFFVHFSKSLVNVC